MVNVRGVLRAALLSGAAFPLVAPAAAQGVDQKVLPPEAQTAAVGEIIVTATRRAERLQDVPISVTAVRGEELARQGVNDPDRLSAVSPSLQTQNGGAKSQGSNFSIRGVGTTSFQRTIDSSVALVIDDVALARTEMGVVNFSDVSQVEVLNGPQGMLFGRNASAGLVHIRTNDPVIGEVSARVNSEYSDLHTGNDTHQFRVNGILNLPVSSDAAVRLNAYYRDNSPILKNVVPNPHLDLGLRQIGGSGKLLWKPNDRLSIYIGGDYMSSKGLNTGASSIRSVSPANPIAPILASAGIEPGPGNTRVSFDTASFENSKVGGAQIKVEYDLGDDIQLTNIAAARFYKVDVEFDPDFLPVPLLDRFTEPKKFRQFSDELRVASTGGGPIDYQFGLYVLNARIRQSNFITGNLGSTPPPGIPYLLGNSVNQVQNLRSYAGFGQVTGKMTEKLRLIGGARLTYDEVDIQYSSDGLGAPIQIIPVADTPIVERHNTDFSWRGTLQYDVSRDNMVYATASRGYKGPGFAQFSTIYVRPEISRHYELGLKSQFFDKRVTFNAALYHTSFRDFQAQAFDPGTLSIFVQNAGELVTKGFELQIAAQPIDGLTISGGLSHANARFKEFKGDICYAGQPDCVGGVTDSSGRRLPNAPAWTGLASIRYERPVSANLVASIGSSLYSRSAVNYSSNGDPATRQEGYTTVDFDLGLRAADSKWRFSVFCRNCTDRRFVGYIQGAPLTGGVYTQQFTYGSFRSIGLSAEMNF
ncbi:TonB-dependent receptor [Sphingobium sp. ZW T5_29]|uniref:TonB-dependent receptor n=1 Tax=Sphingobium sp. ZW T5_29 TaxID=3378077 RepID=UPI003853ECE2